MGTSNLWPDGYFSVALGNLLLIKDKKLLIKEARLLEKYVINADNIYLAFRLATELGNLNLKIGKLENFVINFKKNDYFHPIWLYRFARNVKGANIKKIQSAMIASHDINYIAEFGCFVKGADKELIQDIIIKRNNPKAAYLYLSYNKFCDVEKLKPIVFKSKRPRYLYALAKRTTNKKDIPLIEELILKGGSWMYIRLFAQFIPGADIRKCEDAVIASGSVEQMRKFAKAVKSPRLEKLSLLF
jgi:hypothetical protein